MKTKMLLVFVIAATLISCNTKNKTTKESEENEVHGAKGIVILNNNQREALNLKLGTFLMRNLTTTVKINGQLEVPPSDKADITAIIGGNVKEIKVFHGDKVHKGQVLAILEHPDYISLQENFAEIANKLEYLRQEFERQKELYENNVGAGKDFQKAKAEYYTEKAKYEGLKSRLKMLNLSPEKIMAGDISNTISIKSPLNAYVNEINIKLGSYVDAKSTMFEITDNEAIHADFMIYEDDVHLVKVGQKIHFTISNRSEEEFTATVFAIGKEFDSNSRAVHIHAKIKEKVSKLISGMYISGHLHTDGKYTKALPNDAIVTEGTKSFIFIVDNKELEKQELGEINNKNENKEDLIVFKMIEVITGTKDDGYTEVYLIDSLPENTKVVMNTAYYLLADMNKEETGNDD